MEAPKDNEPGTRKLIERFDLSNGTLEVYEGYPRYRHIPHELPVPKPTDTVVSSDAMPADE